MAYSTSKQYSYTSASAYIYTNNLDATKSGTKLTLSGTLNMYSGGSTKSNISRYVVMVINGTKYYNCGSWSGSISSGKTYNNWISYSKTIEVGAAAGEVTVGFYISSSSSSLDSSGTLIWNGKTNTNTSDCSLKTVTVKHAASYTKCTPPSTVQVIQVETTDKPTKITPISIQKKDTTIRIAWKGAQAGLNSEVSHYAIYYGTSANQINTELVKDKRTNFRLVVPQDGSGSMRIHDWINPPGNDYPTYYFKIKAISSVEDSAYDSDLSAAASVIINTPPSFTLSGSDVTLFSDVETYDYTVSNISSGNTDQGSSLSIKASNGSSFVKVGETTDGKHTYRFTFKQPGETTITFSVTDGIDTTTKTRTITKKSVPIVDNVSVTHTGLKEQRFFTPPNLSAPTTSVSFYEKISAISFESSGDADGYKWEIYAKSTEDNFSSILLKETSNNTVPDEFKASLFTILPAGYGEYYIKITPYEKIGSNKKYRTPSESDRFIIPSIPDNLSLICYNNWNSEYKGENLQYSSASTNVYNKMALQIIKSIGNNNYEIFEDTSLSVGLVYDNNSDASIFNYNLNSNYPTNHYYCCDIKDTDNLDEQKNPQGLKPGTFKIIEMKLTRGKLNSSTGTITVNGPTANLFQNGDITNLNNIIHPFTSNSDYATSITNFAKAERNINTNKSSIKFYWPNGSEIKQGAENSGEELIYKELNNVIQYTLNAITPLQAKNKGFNFNGENKLIIKYQLEDAFGRVASDEVVGVTWDLYSVGENFSCSFGNSSPVYQENFEVPLKIEYDYYNTHKTSVAIVTDKILINGEYKWNEQNPLTATFDLSIPEIEISEATLWSNFKKSFNQTINMPPLEACSESRYLDYLIKVNNSDTSKLIGDKEFINQKKIQRHVIPEGVEYTYSFTPATEGTTQSNPNFTIGFKPNQYGQNINFIDNGGGIIDVNNGTILQKTSEGITKFRVFFECVNQDGENLLSQIPNKELGFFYETNNIEDFRGIISNSSIQNQTFSLKNNEWEYCNFRIRLESIVDNETTGIKNTKIWYGNYSTLYNLVPTISYRKNLLGINTSNIDDDRESIIRICQIDTSRAKVSFCGTPDASGIQHVAYVDLNSLSLKGFSASGGSWSQSTTS